MCWHSIFSIKECFIGKYQTFAEISLNNLETRWNSHPRSMVCSCTGTLYPLLQLMRGYFSVRDRERCTYLKGCFKTPLKSQVIKLLPIRRYNTLSIYNHHAENSEKVKENKANNLLWNLLHHLIVVCVHKKNMKNDHFTPLLQTICFFMCIIFQI